MIDLKDIWREHKMRYFIGLLLTVVLAWSTVGYTTKPDFYSSLITKIGVIHSLDNRIIQYANVNYCNKTVSVTAAHVVKVMPEYSPNSILIIEDDKFDIAIYELLGPSDVSPLATKLPSPFEIVYIPTYYWVEKVNVVYQSPIVGYLEHRTLVQYLGFFGMSGSGAYNSKGEYIGPAIRMFTAPGFDIEGLPGMSVEQQVGIIGIGRTDRLIEMFTKEVCGK